MKITKVKSDQFKEDHLNIIRKLAWSFHRTTGINFEDLYSEACLGYCEGLARFDPHKTITKLETYVYHSIRSILITFTKKLQEEKYQLMDVEHPGSTPMYEFFGSFRVKDQDVNFIFDLALSLEDQIHDLTPRAIRGTIVRRLKSEGWGNPRIWKAMKTAKVTLSETEIGSIIYMNEDPGHL